ncbi:hypothetical protein FB451DRAFT_1178439 [Mycena latifolia]|nr:hypothetical protein FB451DRAFT_1178439 [Mycena latifolia]
MRLQYRYGTSAGVVGAQGTGRMMSSIANAPRGFTAIDEETRGVSQVKRRKKNGLGGPTAIEPMLVVFALYPDVRENHGEEAGAPRHRTDAGPAYSPNLQGNSLAPRSSGDRVTRTTGNSGIALLPDAGADDCGLRTLPRWNVQYACLKKTASNATGGNGSAAGACAEGAQQTDACQAGGGASRSVSSFPEGLRPLGYSRLSLTSERYELGGDESTLCRSKPEGRRRARMTLPVVSSVYCHRGIAASRGLAQTEQLS